MNSIWNSIGVMVYFACHWLITIIVVWLYDDYTNAGNLALAMSITNIFYTVAFYNIRAFQVSDIKVEYNDSEYVIARILTCVFSVLLCAVFVLIAGFSTMQIIIIICYMVFRANEAFIDVLHGIDQKNWRMDYVGISFILRGVFMLAAFVLLGWILDLLSAIMGMAFVTLVIGFMYDVPKTKKLAKFTAYSGKQIFSLLKRCFPLMLVVLISSLIVSFTRYSIERIYDTETLGVYAAVAAPAFIVQIAATLLLTPLANVFAVYLKEKNKTQFVKIFIIASSVIAAITIVFTLASHFLGEWGLKLLFGESIIPYAYLLPGAVIVAGLVALMWLMNLVFSATRDIKGLFIGNLVGAVLCLATADIFLNRYGVIGANHVMVVSQGLVVLCLTVRLFWFANTKQGLFLQQSEREDG